MDAMFAARLWLAVALAATLLFVGKLAGVHLPVWLGLLVVPTSLSGGAFVLSGLMLGLLLAVFAVVCLTAVLYFAFWVVAELARNADVA